MNSQSIRHLIALRYKLMWANTRTRSGKIAIFFVGYLLFILIAILLGAGGFGAAVIAVRSGKAEQVAQIVLSAFFFQALLGTVIMGFGLNAIFSDLELRRYPVNAADRRLVRHMIGIIDPFWILVLVLGIALVLGLYALGAGNLVLGLLAVLLLFVCNYLTARVLALVVDRMMRHKGGAAIMMFVVIGLLAGMGGFVRLFERYPAALDAILRAMRGTPSFGAASAVTANGAAAFTGLAIVVAWLAALTLALIALERRPTVRQRAESKVLSWESPYDRFAAWAGIENAPLVAHWLRFYARNTRFRAMYALTLPLVAFLTYNFGGRPKSPGLVVAAVGTFPILGFIATSRFTVNQFGYVGGGFRRYFVLPTDPATIIRAASFASMMLGAPLIPLALIAWCLLAPVPFDLRVLVMLASSGLTGLFLFHGLGLWSTLYAPRKGNYNQTFGNDLSLAGNIIVIGGIFTFLGVPQILSKAWPGAVSPATWWVGLVIAAAALVFYVISLRAAGVLFASRREQLMAIVEGKA